MSTRPLPEPEDVHSVLDLDRLADTIERARATFHPEGGHFARQMDDKAHAYRVRSAALKAHHMGGDER